MFLDVYPLLIFSPDVDGDSKREKQEARKQGPVY